MHCELYTLKQCEKQLNFHIMMLREYSKKHYENLSQQMLKGNIVYISLIMASHSLIDYKSLRFSRVFPPIYRVTALEKTDGCK